MGRQDAESKTLIPTRGGHFGEPYAFPWKQGGTFSMSGTFGMSGTLVKNQTMAVAIQGSMIGRGDTAGPAGPGFSEDGVSFTLTKTDQHAVAYSMITAMQVRRLTPMECERLQGFPDGYTDIKPNGKPTADGPRYKALGNSMAVPVMRFIGERIASVAAISQIEEMLI